MHRGWLIGMLLRTASLIALAFPAIGCAPAKIVNALVLGEGYRIVRDLAYGPGPRRKLDLYVPDDLCESAPVVVFFYGGRWESGSKEDYLFVGQALASVGFIAVIPDYRLYPRCVFPPSSRTARRRSAGCSTMPEATAAIPSGSSLRATPPAPTSLHCSPSTRAIWRAKA